MTDLNKILALLPLSKFKLNLPQITASRKDEKITGSGYIHQCADGKLALSFINAYPPLKSEVELLQLFFLDRTANFDQTTILTGEDYYDFTGIDEYGNQIDCKYVHLTPDMKRREYTGSFKANIWVRSTDVTASSICHHTVVLFKNKYAFAMDLLDCWQFSLDDLSITYENSEDGQKFTVTSIQTALNDELLVKLIHSLDFVMGLEHEEYFTCYHYDKENFILEINARHFSAIRNSYFTAPYRKTGSQGDEPQVNAQLFMCYFQYLRQQDKSLLTKWHKRVVDSGTGYYYKHGLIAVAIEKILNKYYKIPLPKPEPELLSQLNHLYISLSHYTHETLLKNIQAQIEKMAGKGSFIADKRLAQLEIEGIVSTGSTKSWKKLRHAYAHGDDYTEDLSNAIGLVQRCTTIYYELIFNLIGYQGRYTNYFIPQGNHLTNYPPKNP